MTLYHFHFVQGATLLEDVEGAEFADAAAARTDALRQIRTMIADEVRETGIISLCRRIDIALCEGTIVSRVAFIEGVRISEAPHILP